MIGSAGIAEFAQRPTPTPEPNRTGTPAAPMPQRDPERRVRENNPDWDETQTVDQLARLKELTDVIYRKPTKQELAAVSVRPEFQKKYSQFLSRPDTGIFKLVNFECAKAAQVVSADERCLKLTMPGGAGSFSFRTKNYRIRHLADLTLTEGRLRTTGVLMNGLFAELGDVPIESVTLATPAAAALASVKAAVDASEVEAIAKRFETGDFQGDVMLKVSAEPAVNTTYLMRAIGYRGKVKKALGGVPYNEMDFDRRRDVIAAFRVVDIDTDGSVTIVWQRLSETESPKIDTEEKDEKKRSDGASSFVAGTR